MSAQEAKRFMDAITEDKKLAEEVRVAIKAAGEATAAAYASVAKGFAFDFEAGEFVDELKARQKAAAQVVDGAELSDEDLDQVAGGLCVLENYCFGAISFYKEHEECSTTYRDSETCYVDDLCAFAIITY